MSDDFFSSKNERLPRWFRAIRWGENWARFIERRKRSLMLGWVPFVVFYFLSDNMTAQEILRLRPQTEEELDAIRRRWSINEYFRDHEMGMYRYDIKPHYDMWERRRKYPEHYGDRYEGYKRYDSNMPLFSKDKPIEN